MSQLKAPEDRPSTQAFANPLDQLAAKYRTDKGTVRPSADLAPKSYTIPYFRYLERIRNEPLALLEIGVKRGSSLRMWEAFLPNAAIFGIDINPTCLDHATPRSRVFIGDQGDPNFLQSVVDAAGRKFDVIIDDGSHVMEHHQASLKFLWPHLRDGGWYAIEDLHTCMSKDYGGGYRSPSSTIELVLKPLLDSLSAPNVKPAPFVAGVSSVHVYRSIAFLFKGEPAQM